MRDKSMEFLKEKDYVGFLSCLQQEKNEPICFFELFEVASKLSFNSMEWIELVKAFHRSRSSSTNHLLKEKNE
ncbi:Uncharacterised protein [Lysinibacillus capsici]|uniref:Uncharacterized protein n=1 Tax=Lysinibacillus capsici TaxID=2115968 RepID=A0A2X1AB05_9BACI|nr:hypothetical protein [Lysinibacillus capsici]SPU40710.1 Uncharacterised protein [Lysinibacillus capsici]